MVHNLRYNNLKKSHFLEMEHCGFIGAKFENLFALASGIEFRVSLNSRQFAKKDPPVKDIESIVS